MSDSALDPNAILYGDFRAEHQMEWNRLLERVISTRLDPLEPASPAHVLRQVRDLEHARWKYANPTLPRLLDQKQLGPDAPALILTLWVDRLWLDRPINPALSSDEGCLAALILLRDALSEPDLGEQLSLWSRPRNDLPDDEELAAYACGQSPWLLQVKQRAEFSTQQRRDSAERSGA